eukprot:TRINITY_DN10159_c0_g1_i1.p1 TRINITY_DN10159_c0_g1~~TRINITY_DN10159_c0_g1_i1.p1  ORF type:complete len:310 (-),score=65.77 TRINITY_DN10159_c0_g1_i1:203-1132(-)
MIRRPPRSTLSSSSAASDVYKRQHVDRAELEGTEASMVSHAIRRLKNLTEESYANMTISKKRYEVEYWRQYEGLMRTSIMTPNAINNTKWYENRAAVDRWKLMVTFECVESYMNASLKAVDTDGKYSWVEPSIGTFLAEMRSWRETQNNTNNHTAPSPSSVAEESPDAPSPTASPPAAADGIADELIVSSDPVLDNDDAALLASNTSSPSPSSATTTASTPRPRFPFSEMEDLSFLHMFTERPIDDDTSAMMYLIKSKMQQWEQYKWSIVFGTIIMVYWGYGMVRIHTTATTISGFEDLIYELYRLVFG